MLIDLIVGTLMTFLTGVLGLFPSWELPSSMTDFGAGIGAAVATANGVFPFVTLGVCLGVYLSAQLFVYLVAVVQWVYELIPFKAT